MTSNMLWESLQRKKKKSIRLGNEFNNKSKSIGIQSSLRALA